MSVNPRDEYWMRRALELAQEAEKAGEVPVGAVVVDADDRCLGEGYNQPIGSRDPSAHAEIVALRAAAQEVGNYRLPHCTLFVTIEPCTMCVGAMVHARIQRLVFAAAEPKAGAVVSRLHLLDSDKYNHQIDYQGGILADAAGELMAGFFKRKRN
jgi:tRNA(adenine34) deaminase